MGFRSSYRKKKGCGFIKMLQEAFLYLNVGKQNDVGESILHIQDYLVKYIYASCNPPRIMGRQVNILQLDMSEVQQELIASNRTQI